MRRERLTSNIASGSEHDVETKSTQTDTNANERSQEDKNSKNVTDDMYQIVRQIECPNNYLLLP